MSKRTISVLMLSVLLFSFTTLILNTPLSKVEGTTNAESNSMSSQWLAATSWNKTYGGASADYAYSVVQTSDEGFALAGGTYSYGAGNGDFWLVKTDSSGNVAWSRTYGGNLSDLACSVVQTSDGGYALAGYTNSFGAGSADSWLVKTDSAGNMLWNKTYGGARYDLAYSIVQTSDGGYALAGYTGSYGAGAFDSWLVKTDSAGNMLWNKTYGGAGDDLAYSVVLTSDGGYAIAGYTYSYGAGSTDAWLVKTDGSGNMLWSKTYGGTGNEDAHSVVLTSDGGYAIAGSTASYGGGWDMWLVKTDSAGNMLWNKTYGGAGNDVGFSMVQTNDRGYAIAGYTYSYGVGIPTYSNLWLVKTDSAGNMLWNKTYGGANHDRAQSVVRTSDGGYALAGYTGSYGAGAYDFWLVKLTPQTIYIRANGSVDPSSAPIVSNGSLYTLTDNITSITDGIVIQKDSITLDGARYTVQGSGAGYGIILGSHVTVRNVNVRSFYYGVVGNGTSYSLVSRNNLTDNNYGVWLYSVNSTVSQNIVSGSIFGVKLFFSTRNNVSDNVITGNYQGAYLNGTTLTTISRNKFAGNSNGGIGLRASSDNTITRNRMENNGAGIWLWKSASSNNLICENNITGTTGYGIGLLQYASNNAFYHNNFENNTVQVYFGDNTTVNAWDDGYPSGGNYWSNYLNRTDLCRGVFQNIIGSDAIADTGFSLDVNNRDNYPLMGLFGSPTGKGTNVTVFPTSEVGLTFKNVTTAGSTTVNETATGPPIPQAYNLVGQYLDIKTTAAYTGEITLRFIYNDTDMSKLVEQNLRLKYWNATSSSWEDVTTLVDTVNNVIYGETDHLSIFTTHSISPNPDPDLEFLSTTCAKTIIGQGYSAAIDVTVRNGGTVPKTFNVNVFANANVIGTQTITGLDPGEQRAINFVWQVPSNYHKGNYTLIVGDLAGWGITAMIGDVSGIGTFPDTLPDGKVDIKDLAALAKVYGVNYPAPRYVANYDITGPTTGLADGKIDIRDLAAAAKNYGKIDP